ncbi:MAG: heavy metal-binding domain-containing protein, partial [Methylocella sp.]
MIVTTMDGIAGSITEETLGVVRGTSLWAMQEQARRLQADAIIGLRLEVIEMSNGVFCVNAVGTAVTTVKLPQSVPGFTQAPGEDFDFDVPFQAARDSFAGSSLR